MESTRHPTHTTVTESGPDRARGADRSRLDMAFATARPSSTSRTRRGIPGLRTELFPAATWRADLERLAAALDREQDEQVRREEARLAYLLSHPRAEDILHAARTQAQRLVGTAAAVARARREQADREAAAAIADAEKVAEGAMSAARRHAEELTADHSGEMTRLNERLLRLRSALQDAETKLGAYSSHTRRSSTLDAGVIDLEEEQARGDLENIADDETVEIVVDQDLVIEEQAPRGAGETSEDAALVEAARAPRRASVSNEQDGAPQPAPRLRPKGRFTVPGLTPDRIEALRDELTP